MVRRRISLDGTWDFFPDPDQRLDPQNLERAGPPRQIRVPGPWQAQFDDLRDYSGVAWYRRAFELPEMTNDGQPLLDDASSAALRLSSIVHVVHFGAVDYYARVWLNGKLLGEHEGGYLPFEFVLDAALRLDGPNELVVCVIDPGADPGRFPQFPFAEIPHGKQSWYGPIGGIWQSVYLEARSATHITRLQITPDVPGERAHVTAYLSRPLEQPARLVLAVTDPRGQITSHQHALNAGTQRYATVVPIPEPLLWDTHSPHLYRLEATLASAAPGSAGPEPADDRFTALDSLAATFGMRTIATSPEGHLLLNGRIIYLRGALDQDYYPQLIYTPFSDAELEDQFAKAKHMGLNCLRTHIKITDPRYYDAADRAGLLIWTELPNWEQLTDAARQRARETLTGMVERDWNHPSIIIWTIINEGWGVDLAMNSEHRAWLAETYAYLKQLDPHRLVVGNSPCLGNFHVVTDIEDFHNYYAVPDHYRQWRAWVEAFAARPPWTFAHVYEGIEAWRAAMRDPWSRRPRTPAPEVRRRGNEPLVVSEFGNWGLPDVAKLRACYGGHDPWWFETGWEWGEGVVYPHGIEQRFKTFHLDKVFPTIGDLVAASQRMQFVALKYEIEQIRRHPAIVGYIITEFTDVHWECNGLLDMCRNPKVFYDTIGAINSADVIVPDWDRVVFWEGERCEVRLALSHFSDVDLRGSRLEWWVDQWPEIRGAFEGLMLQPAQASVVGTVAFDVPPLERSARARLEMRLRDARGEVVASNFQELYFFPHRLAQPPRLRLYAPELAPRLRELGYLLVDNLAHAELAVAGTLTDELRWYVQNGGRALWLAEDSDSRQTHLGALNIVPRKGHSWQGDWASTFSWIRQDRMFQEIPTDGSVDFAFADLTPDHVIVGLRPRAFEADVHAGLFVGWLHHPVALVAERRIGRGRLLISTFCLREHLATNPVARIMVNDMLVYLARLI